jgi:hypothetical protein
VETDLAEDTQARGVEHGGRRVVGAMHEVYGSQSERSFSVMPAQAPGSGP